MTSKEAEDYFNSRIAKKGVRPDHSEKILPEILNSIKEDLPIIKFFERMLEFEAKVRRVQDELNAQFWNPADLEKNTTG